MFERILTTADKLIAVEIPSIHATQTEDAPSSVPDVPKVGTDVGGNQRRTSEEVGRSTVRVSAS